VTKVDAIGGEPVVTDGTAVTQVSEFSRGTRRSRRSNVPATLAWVVTAVAVVLGTFMRAWYLFHRPTTSDESIAGLMANQILHGHFSAFYWGQSYGGIEPYLVALRLALFGNSNFLLALVATLLSGVSGIVTWRIARHLVADPALAALAAAAAWVAPQSVPFNATYEYGFRGVTLLLGLLLVLLALRILDGDRRPAIMAALGLTAGAGWWSSPEIVYFVVPAALIVIGAIVADRTTPRWPTWIRGLIIAAAGAVAGAFPWLWANLQSGFASLNSSSFILPVGAPHYVGRLRLFSHYSLPILFSLRGQSGAWLFARAFSVAILGGLVIILCVAGVLCLLGPWSYRAIAISVLLFPFLLVVSPATWFWADGRYAGYVVPLVALVFVMGVAEADRRWRGRRQDTGVAAGALGLVATAGLVAVLTLLSVANFDHFTSPVSGYLADWGNPDGPTVRILPRLESDGVRNGYADYWTAYRLDYLSAGKLRLTVAGLDPDRWATLNHEVTGAPSAAWIFVVPTPTAQSQFSGTATLGPGGLSESALLGDLQRRHIGYRIISSGFIRAVVPDHAVRPAQLGLP